MVEKFNNTFYLIIFLIHFAAYGIYAYKSFYYDPMNEWKLISDSKNHVYIVKNRGEDICHYSSKEIINNVGITGKWLKTKCDNN